MQEAVRDKMGGNVTTFSSVSDGQHTLQTGDVLRLATKPVLVGRALHFVVGQVSACSVPCMQLSQPFLLASGCVRSTVMVELQRFVTLTNQRSTR